MGEPLLGVGGAAVGVGAGGEPVRDPAAAVLGGEVAGGGDGAEAEGFLLGEEPGQPEQQLGLVVGVEVGRVAVQHRGQCLLDGVRAGQQRVPGGAGRVAHRGPR